MKFFSTTCETLFLGWDAPLLPRVTDLLSERYANGANWDLGGLICVLPSTQSAKRLGELIRERASEAGWNLVWPQMVTVGEVPELLYTPPQTLALDFEQTLAWAHVLQATHTDELQKLLSVLPAPEPLGPWLELAGTIRRLYEDLASSNVGFQEVMAAAETDGERDRWKLLDQLWHAYLERLNSGERADPYHSRLQAALKGQVHSDSTVMLIGTTDLNESLRAMLRAMSSELIAVVAAPSTKQGHFDELGCVNTADWLDYQLPLRDEHLIAADDIGDQSAAVAEVLASFAADPTVDSQSDRIAVGVTDTSHVAPVELQLSGVGITTHRHIGWTLSQTAIGRLLDLTTAFVQRRTWRSLAALVRHADVHAYVSHHCPALAPTENSKKGVPDKNSIDWFDDDWITDFDRLLSDHHPVSIDDVLPGVAKQRHGRAEAIAMWITQWLSEHFGSVSDRTASQSTTQRPIGQWSRLLSNWLGEVYAWPRDSGKSTPPVHRNRTGLALDAAQRMLERFSTMSETLDVPVSGPVALELLTARLTDLRISEVPNEDETPILGWLDLALEDAPALVVLGFNHPFVPSSVTSDPFLPGTLRSRLNLPDNERRYARDAYAMQLMLSSREHIRFIVGRTAADGTPTPPSRLLAAASPEDLARRVTFLLEDQRHRVDVLHSWDAENETSKLHVPSLQVDQCPVKAMSVTAFRDYLSCPYRFYLRHVLKMKPLDDSLSELAANQFGDLVHGSLETFGMSLEKDETDPKRIEALMLEHLDKYVAEHYGDHVTSAVRLQIRQAQRRLKIVAQRQAERIAAGWIIHGTELAIGEADGSGIDVDGQRMVVRGRFDRIDHHPATDRWAILDYKTHGHKPEKKHFKTIDGQTVWLDLQLPLYRMLAPFLGITVPPQEIDLGYFNVGDNANETGINIAKFTEEQMQQAEALIHECIRGIRACKFEPTSDRVQYDDYEMILQTKATSRMLNHADSDSIVEVG
ncbi:PD-(D/E)XK nuclease family protein [Stieleria varia]|uniref:ATP-dependent helicase/deoxyribonuclease subunit B n=1 Tax=Stieleria varia TaxID=2528005 RepID=A0A5C6ARL6_9BACT|nr:PD-(D/E)XK nuclease family protein [Stieleria varia]TWU02340.1 ATP-dependent helicase/deoxyribonuclease subunit B [Stieleria varia]